MKNALRMRFWLEVGMGTVTGILFIVTVVWRDWIEIIFKVDPDQGSGLLEWAVVAILLVATLTLFFLARSEWRKHRISIA